MKRHITALIAGGVLALAQFGSAAAGPLDDGYAAYQRGDYAEALHIWGQLADQGLAGAQFDLGFMYANGHGVPQNYERALFWYREAADQGYACAQDDTYGSTWLRHVRGKRPSRPRTVMTWPPR